jgi:chromosome segregation ATPase
MKRFFGLLALLLGLVGLLACVAAVGFAWWASNRYLGQAAETAGRVEKLLTTADKQANRLQDDVSDTRTRIEELRAAARTVAARGDESDPADRARVETLIANLSSKIERGEDLAETLRSAALILRNGTALAAALSKDEEKAERLRSAEKILGETVKKLSEVRDKLARARRGDDLRGTAGDVAVLADDALPALSRVEEGISEVEGFLSRAGKEVAEVREALTFWKTAGPILATLILAWVALGQASLLARGWSMLRGTGSNAT